MKFPLFKHGCIMITALLMAACSTSGGGSDSVRGIGISATPIKLNNDSLFVDTSVSTNTPPSTNGVSQSDSASIANAIKQTFETENGKLKTVKAGMEYNVNGTLLSIQSSGQSSVKTNDTRGFPAEFASIIVNDKRIALLDSPEIKQKAPFAFKALDNNDFYDLAGNDKVGMPQGAKGGWLGTLGEFANYYDSGAWSNIRYGVYVDEKNVSHLFVMGKEAPVRTGDGRFAFSGHAIIGKDGNYKTLPNSVSGIADWTNKKVDLSIKDGDNGTIKVGGKIEGNTFGGNIDGVETRGAFYGTISSELGGMFSVGSGQYNGYNGVFGATRGGRLAD